MSLHPRADNAAAPDNLGLILNNVAALIPDSSLAGELGAAASSLIDAADKSNYEEMADTYFASLMSSLESNNDAEHAQGMASELATLIQFAEDIPDNMAEPYSSLLSALQNTEIAADAADVVNELIKFVSDVYFISPEAFDDVPQATETSMGAEDAEETATSAADSSERASRSSDKDNLSASEEASQTSEDADEHSEPDSSTSDAPATRNLTCGLAALGLAISTIVSVF
ncbi:hypothetical protein LPJ56_000759 [Coemansia sp. RSA 2599]|nr:hypothetical protein LPJ75_000245 [Coemansia sp. RSA 2598]KAJ1828937.1 hypothetical protein LPJ56_000759 [Coemansia sp. RSA 2599]